jgi:DNA-binding MarR family transcriptional regulator
VANDRAAAVGATVAALREVILAGEHYRTVAARELDLTPTESRAVSYLMARGPMGQNELAQALHLAAGSTTALVDRLEKRDIVKREAHATDRRRSIVHLTTTNTEVVDRLRSWLTDVCQTLPARSRGEATTLLTTLAAALNERVDRAAAGA